MAEKRREQQLAYSEIQSEMLRPESRKLKAQKMQSVLDHFLGVDWVGNSVMLDVGASLGFNVEAAAVRGATSIGMDIDVPGLAIARRERDPRCVFIRADGEAIPAQDNSIDVVILNHIYEHVVDADAVVAEIYRVLKPTGVAYFGMANKLVIVEPHYKLPFLSWLPQGLADRYMKLGGKGDHYHESFRTMPGLKAMLRKFYVTDYSFSIMAHPDRFNAGDLVGGRVASAVQKMPAAARRAARGVIPTYIWLGTKAEMAPAGRELAVPPELISRPS